MAHAIAVSGLTKDYGGGRGILDLDLHVPEGRVFGFLGPNGAGKTTTLRVLMGFLQPDRGSASLLGRAISSDRAALNRLIGYVPGELALPGAERVGDYLDRCARLQQVANRTRQRALVEQLRVPRSQRIRELSKGNRQKVALVQALQHGPPLLVLDEPTDGLDPVLRRRVGEMLREHAAGGGTVFLSSHVVHEVETVCDDVAIVVAGRLRHQAPTAQLLRGLPLRVDVTVPAASLRAAQLKAASHGARAQAQGDRLRVEVRGDPLPLLAALERLGAHDAVIQDKDLEETFMHLYQEGAATPPPKAAGGRQDSGLAVAGR